jgi:hypothetical protein
MNSWSGGPSVPASALKMASHMPRSAQRTKAVVECLLRSVDVGAVSPSAAAAHGRSRSIHDDCRRATCHARRSAKAARSDPIAHPKTKRNQTSHRLLVEAINHNPLTVGIPLLGPDPHMYSRFTWTVTTIKVENYSKSLTHNVYAGYDGFAMRRV